MRTEKNPCAPEGPPPIRCALPAPLRRFVFVVTAERTEIHDPACPRLRRLGANVVEVQQIEAADVIGALVISAFKIVEDTGRCSIDTGFSVHPCTNRRNGLRLVSRTAA